MGGTFTKAAKAVCMATGTIAFSGAAASMAAAGAVLESFKTAGEQIKESMKKEEKEERKEEMKENEEE